MEKEEKDPGGVSCSFAFLLCSCPRFAPSRHFKELVEFFMCEERAYEKLCTPWHTMQPPRTVTLFHQSVQRPSPICPHSVVAQGAGSGWHLFAPCRHCATLGFSPVLALWPLLSDGFKNLVDLKLVCLFFVERLRTTFLPALSNSGQKLQVSLIRGFFLKKLWIHVKFCQILFLHLLK